MTGARHIEVREDWLALHNEPVLDPGLPIIDAHHHLWDKPGSRYLLEEMQSDIDGGHNVCATVFVEGAAGYRTDGPAALRSLGETALAAGIASNAKAAGGTLVAHRLVVAVDLSLGQAAGEILDAHSGIGEGRLRGVRQATAWHADPAARGSTRTAPPGQLYDLRMRAGLRELAKRRLVFDAWMYHTQLGDLVDLARAIPDLRVVINHLGGPLAIGPYAGREAEVRADWTHFMSRLADCPNVCCKLGGLGMAMSGFRYHEAPRPPESGAIAAGWGPYLRTCIELFGPERCMFESNFPVDKGMLSYTVLWNAFKRIARDQSPEDRSALFFGTANRVYSLGLETLKCSPTPRDASETKGMVK